MKSMVIPPPDEIEPERPKAIETIQDAVNQVRSDFAKRLHLGTDVNRGVVELAKNAGPSDKVYRHLQALDELADALEDGPLGVDTIKWLRDQNFDASTESKTTKNSKKEMLKRKWNGEEGQEEFHLHLKVTEAVAPDKCVRIYFEYSRKSGKVIIGWVGRRP